MHNSMALSILYRDPQCKMSKNTITTSDSSVFILELGSSATGPCCNTPCIGDKLLRNKMQHTFLRGC